MTLSLLAMLALLSISFEVGEDMDFLTVQDIKLILELTLPRKHYHQKDLIKFINDRYNGRYSAKMSHYKL